MRLRFIAAIVIVLLVATVAYASQFCAGFRQGYVTGWQQASGSGMVPMAPMCPMQPMKRLNDPSSDYEHGYIIGFTYGLSDGG